MRKPIVAFAVLPKVDIWHLSNIKLLSDVKGTSINDGDFMFKIPVKEPGSVVGIATAYGLEGPGIESPWGRDFPHLSRSVLRPTQPHVQGVPGLSRE
jgi:hypothetical protein